MYQLQHVLEPYVDEVAVAFATRQPHATVRVPSSLGDAASIAG
jgi:hypothetical protein